MDLRQSFSDIYKEVSEYLGTGDMPVDRDLKKAKEIVHKGYRNFLYPRNDENGKRHWWSFLEKPAVLMLEEGRWQYTLPADFDRMKMRFHYSQDTGYGPMSKKDMEFIRNKRTFSEAESYPMWYAVVPQPYSKNRGQFYEAWFYETPDGGYETHYSYYHNPPKLELVSDYFVGGHLHGESILACCLAEAELKHEHKIGDMHNKAHKLLQEAIQGDSATKPDTVGLNRDPGVNQIGWQRYLPPIQQADVYTS